MEKVFISYLLNSVNVALYILLLILVQRILRKHFSAVCLYRIWVILLLGLLIPVRFEFIKPILDLRIPRISEANRVYDEQNYQNDTILNSIFAEGKVPLKKGVSLQKGNSNKFSYQLLLVWLEKAFHSRFVFLIWIAGAVLTFSSSSFSYYRYKNRLKRYLKPIEQEVIKEELKRLKEELYTKRKSWYNWKIKYSLEVTVCECSVISSPITIGIWKPVIILPKESYTKKDLSFLLQHELTHIHQCDALIKFIRLIVLSINWFNPLCYVLSGNIDKWCEAACDEIVLRKSTRSDRLHYCRLILNCAASQIKRTPVLLTHFYGGKNNMKQRLGSILNKNKRRPGNFLLILILCIVSTTVIVVGNNQKAMATSDAEGSEIEPVDQIDAEAEVPELGVIDQAETKTEVLEQGAADNVNTESADVVEAEVLEPDTIDNTNGNIITPQANTSLPEQEASNTIDANSMTAGSSSDTQALRDSIVEFALQAETVPYVWGGNDLSTGVDSSGFVQAVYSNFGYELARTSREQLSNSVEVSVENLKPGDLVFYKPNYADIVNHVGIYIGDGKIIHATNLRDGVKIAEMNYRPPYCGGRYLPD